MSDPKSSQSSNKNTSTFSHLRRLFFFLKMSKVNMWFLSLSIFFSFLYALVATYAIYLLFPLAKGIITNDFGHVKTFLGVHFIVTKFPDVFNNSTSLFILLVVWLYLITLIKNVFYYLSFLSAQAQAKIATVNLREILVSKFLSFSKSFYDKNTISYLQSVLNKSTSLVASGMRLVQGGMAEILLLCAYLSMMLMISWKLTLAIGIIFPFIIMITRTIVRNIQKHSMEHQRLTTNFNEKIFNILYCMPVIKSFVKEQYEMDAFSKANNEEIEQSFKMQRLSGLIMPIEDIGAMTGNLFIAFAIAYVMQMDHAFEASKTFVFFYLAMRTLPSLNAFNRFKMGVVNSSAALENIEEILTQSESYLVQNGSQAFGGFKKGIEFKDLSFSFTDKGPLVLDKVDFSIDKRSIVAIVGPSGSGKSTLVNLLLRFYECPESSIFIDGKDIRDYEISSLRKSMAFISQDVLLFNDTIRHNIAYGSSSQITDESLREFALNMGIEDLIEKMPNKYETFVGDRGARLSGGEKQKISIARAMIKEADILIMDEATSSLDSNTESKITEGILSMAKEKTIILIAHRLSTIKRADKVIYLEKGRVLESGTLQELIDKKGLFYKQWEAQKI